MTDTARTEVARLARVRDEELTGLHAGAAAQALLADVMAEPVHVPARTARVRPARRLVLAAAAVLAATTAVVAGPSLIEDGTGGATSYANSAIAVDREGGFFVARIKDPLADHARYAEAFRAVGLDVDIALVPVSPKLVGQLIASGSGGTGEGGNTVVTDLVSAGPAPVDCPREPARCTIIIRIAADSTGWMRFTVGRAARPGEAYTDGEAAPGGTSSGGPGSTATWGGK
jgi:hypothetical protein